MKLGFISFGGPAGQIAIMHAELVERRRWNSEQRFLHALNDCMVLPGPEVRQLATYFGWLRHRTWGGIAAGALFVLPSPAILIALSWTYIRFGNVPLVAGLFYGLKPAVTALVPHGERLDHAQGLDATLTQGAGSSPGLRASPSAAPMPCCPTSSRARSRRMAGSARRR